MLPFSERQFFDLFERYNEAIWPLQLAAYAIAVLSVGAAFISHRWSAAALLSSVALLWLWTGLSYHWAFFSSINPMACVFAVLFGAQAPSKKS